MSNLRNIMMDRSRFLYGVELVTTRGTMEEAQAVKTRELAAEIAECDRIDWVSITDNAGGNPMLSPMALGKPLLYNGKDVVIHLSCKDFNRNGLESEAWQLSSEGFNNILALGGDYPTSLAYHGQAKPVFDIDSVGLLDLMREMNKGLKIWQQRAKKNSPERLQKTAFFLGAVVNNFKLHENEVMPQYFKLEKKIEAGAQFIINQIGYDARKKHELKLYLEKRGLGKTPLIGNVFMLTKGRAAFFNAQKMPGVVVSDELLALCRQQAHGPDRGHQFFIEFAAKQVAIYRGLGYHGAYLGGVERTEDILRIMDLADSYAPDDWRQFTREMRFSRPGEFFSFHEDPETGLADPNRPTDAETARARRRTSTLIGDLNYKINKWVHARVFTPGAVLHRLGRAIYSKSAKPEQGPAPLRVFEHAAKSALFGCKDCGDCSLPDIAFLCPESHCVKNQRNGPCGGTRDGKCEVEPFDCIWSIAYDRLKMDGREKDLLAHVPTIQDQSLRGTSSWGNALRGLDHHGKLHRPGPAEKQIVSAQSEQSHPPLQPRETTRG